MTRHDAPLPAERLALRREHLMSETTPSSRRRGLSRRAKVIVGGVLAASVAGGGLAAAGGPSVFRRSDGVVEIDGQHLTPLYYGQRLSLDQVKALNKQHKAMVSVNNVEVGCHGVSLYFDTPAEADAYGRDFTARLRALRAKQEVDGTLAAHLAGDPCADWRTPLPTFTRSPG